VTPLKGVQLQSELRPNKIPKSEKKRKKTKKNKKKKKKMKTKTDPNLSLK